MGQIKTGGCFIESFWRRPHRLILPLDGGETNRIDEVSAKPRRARYMRSRKLSKLLIAQLSFATEPELALFPYIVQ